jgi:hypothetical protein
MGWARHHNEENEDENSGEDELLQTRMETNNNLRRDISSRIEQLVTDIKMIQLDLELLQRNDGIVSLEALHLFGAFDSNYYGWFTGPDKEEV